MQADTAWQDAVKQMSPYVVKIFTPEGTGTGFLIYRAKSSAICGIATAAHVLDRAHEWGQPIRVRHHESGMSKLLPAEARSVFIDQGSDTAILVFEMGLGDERMPFPDNEIFLWEQGKYLKVGNEVGWIGFPSVAPENLCFFSGRVSCYLHDNSAYLIDGVAINGVSGGPTFFVMDLVTTIGVSTIGVISAYMPNRATGVVLPGVAIVQDVTKLHEWVTQFKTLDEAQKGEPSQDEPPSTQP